MKTLAIRDEAPAVATQQFCVEDLSQEKRQTLLDNTSAINGIIKQVSHSCVLIGKHLLEIKRVLSHGQFTYWINANFGWTIRSAQRFMCTAEKFGEREEIQAFVSAKVLYLLSAPSTPKEATEEIISMAKKDISPTFEEAKKIVEKYKRKSIAVSGGVELVEKTRASVTDLSIDIKVSYSQEEIRQLLENLVADTDICVVSRLRTSWTAREKALLREKHSQYTAKELVSFFPGRNLKSIQMESHRQGLKKSNKGRKPKCKKT